MLHYTYKASEDEKRLKKLVNINNTYQEINNLLSFENYLELQTLLFTTHCDDVNFVDMWVEHLPNISCIAKSGKLRSIIFKPKYENVEVITMQCIDIVDYNGITTAKEYIELKSGEDYVPIENVKTKSRVTKGRVNFVVEHLRDEYYSNRSLYTPEFNSLSSPTFYQDYIIDKEDVQNLKRVPHFSKINVKIKRRSWNAYYSQFARIKAIEFYDNFQEVGALVQDIDSRVRTAAIERLAAKDKLSRTIIYKMLESHDVNIRMKAIELLKGLDGV